MTQQDDTSYLNDLKPDDVKEERNVGENDADHDKMRNTVEAKTDDASGYQTGQEEGNEGKENVK